MKSAFLLACLKCFCIVVSAQVSPGKPDNKAVSSDTLLLSAPNILTIPFEPHETNFRKYFTAAKSSKERTSLLKTYIDAVYTSSLSDDDKKVLMSKKLQVYINIDFYSLYEYFTLMAKESNNTKAMFITGVYRKTLNEEQWSALTEYMKYVVASGEMQVYNQTTGVTETLKRPSNWPVGLPLPGYGWGKYTSSDDVAPPVSMQYHLSAEERYTIISGYIQSGKNISPDDKAWHTVYEQNKPQKKPVARASNATYIKTDEELLSELVGKIFRYESLNYFDCTTCKVISYKNKQDISLTCKYGNTKKATYDELVKNINKYGYHPATLVLTQCKACNGKGVVKTSFSHTNDYQYTLGKKYTYTSSSIVTCTACDGSGYDDGF